MKHNSHSKDEIFQCHTNFSFTLTYTNALNINKQKITVNNTKLQRKIKRFLTLYDDKSSSSVSSLFSVSLSVRLSSKDGINVGANSRSKASLGRD